MFARKCNVDACIPAVFPKFDFIGPTTLNLTTGGIFINWISSSFHIVFIKSRSLFLLCKYL